MDCSSVISRTLSSQTHFQSKAHKISPQSVLFSKKLNLAPSTTQTHLQKQLCFHSKIEPRHPIQLTTLPSIPYFTNSHLLQKPISNNFKTHCSTTPQPNILKTTVEKITIMLVGSLLFMGSLGCKPVAALPTAQNSSSSAPMEENIDTQSGKSDDEEMYMRLLKKNPRDIEALKLIVNGKMRKGNTKEAVEYVERLIEIEPDEVEWRLLQALSFEMMGNITKAKRLFKEILVERPLLLRALHGLAMVMHKNLEGPAIFEMLDKALELARREKRVTEERNIRILIAQMHVVKGELEEGLKKFQDLVNENPRDFRPYLCQGIIYSLLDRKMEAEEQFEIYQSLVPHEFPQKGFLDDVVMEARTEQIKKGFEAEFSQRKMGATP